MKDSIGEKIRELRISKKLTQQELSKQCDISLSALNKYERNERKPKLETLEKICNVLDTSVQYILGMCRYSNHYSDTIESDCLALCEICETEDKQIGNAVSSIIDKTFLTIYNLARDEQIETLLILEHIYKFIWSINNIDNDFLIEENIKDIKENFYTLKTALNTELDNLFKQLQRNTR